MANDNTTISISTKNHSRLRQIALVQGSSRDTMDDTLTKVIDLYYKICHIDKQNNKEKPHGKRP